MPHTPEHVKFRSTKDVFPGRVGGGRNPDALISPLIDAAFTPRQVAVTAGSAAPPLQPGLRPPPLTETLRPAPITDAQNLAGGGVGGTFAPGPLVTPTAAQLSRPVAFAQPPALTPAPIAAAPVVPDTQPDGVGPDLLTARGFSPGVTEIVGGTGSRLFTNLLSPTATPEAATGFARRAATEGIRLPGQLSTTARPLEGDQFAINRLINAPEDGVVPPVDGRQPNGFGAPRGAAPTAEFITTEDVLRRQGNTGTGSGLIRRNARQIAQEENAASARAENIATRDIKLGFAGRRVATAEKQVETQAKQAETAATKVATAASKDLDTEFKPFFSEILVDPLNLLSAKTKTLTGFTTEGGANIPAEAVEQFRAAIADPANADKVDEIKRRFKARFLAELPQ